MNDVSNGFLLPVRGFHPNFGFLSQLGLNKKRCAHQEVRWTFLCVFVNILEGEKFPLFRPQHNAQCNGGNTELWPNKRPNEPFFFQIGKFSLFVLHIRNATMFKKLLEWNKSFCLCYASKVYILSSVIHSRQQFKLL